RHDEIAGAIDPLAVAERPQHRLAERDADIFDRMVLIDVEIAPGLQRQVEAAVPREELQHVIEKADPGPDVVAPLSIDREAPFDVRLGRPAVERCGPLHRGCLAATTDSSASMAAFV